ARWRAGIFPAPLSCLRQGRKAVSGLCEADTAAGAVRPLDLLLCIVPALDGVEIAATALARCESRGAGDALPGHDRRAPPGFHFQRVVDVAAPSGIGAGAVGAQAGLREA